jgi:hypothetical protein
MTRTYVSLALIIIVLLPIYCSVFWMKEDSCVCFLMIAVSKSFKTYWLIADKTLFLSDYNCIIRTHLYNCICQKVSLVLLVLHLKKLWQFCGVFPLPVTLCQAQYLFSCKYNCMLERLRLPLVLHILQTSSISLNALYLLKPIVQNDEASFWLSVRRSKVCLQNCCKLRFLTDVEITIITQCSRIIFSIKSYSLKLAGYKNRREQTTVVL